MLNSYKINVHTCADNDIGERAMWCDVKWKHMNINVSMRTWATSQKFDMHNVNSFSRVDGAYTNSDPYSANKGALKQKSRPSLTVV